MNIKKMFILTLFLMIVASVTMGVSCAESSEKIRLTSGKMTETLDKKIVSIDMPLTYGKDFIQHDYKINIKKNHQSKYKIKSVRCKYIEYSDGTRGYNPVYKTYNGKNKNSVIIKTSYKNCFLESLTINFQTKEKIKKESIKLKEGETLKAVFDSVWVGKKAKVTLKETGSSSYQGQVATFKNQKFTIKTTNEKYKIKTIKVIYFDMEDKVSKTRTFQGNGKTTYTNVIRGSFNQFEHSLGQFQITYY